MSLQNGKQKSQSESEDRLTEMTQPEEEKKRLNKKRNIKPAGQHEKSAMYNCSFRREK